VLQLHSPSYRHCVQRSQESCFTFDEGGCKSQKSISKYIYYIYKYSNFATITNVLLTLSIRILSPYSGNAKLIGIHLFFSQSISKSTPFTY
jgi:hypothetical protein